jgi:hypothetical protein
MLKKNKMKWKTRVCTDSTYDIVDEDRKMIAGNMTKENAEIIVDLYNHSLKMKEYHD